MPTKIFSWRVKDYSLWFSCWGELFLCHSAFECEILLTTEPCKQHLYRLISWLWHVLFYFILLCLNYSCIGQKQTNSKTKFVKLWDRLAIQKGQAPLQNQPVGAYKYCYDPMTPWKFFYSRPGLYTLRSRSILEGFAHSHHIITVLYSPPANLNQQADF